MQSKILLPEEVSWSFLTIVQDLKTDITIGTYPLILACLLLLKSEQNYH